MKKIRVAIVDDERSAREEIKSALKQYEDFILIGEAANVEEAVELIERETPDLIFLDIQMPEQSGFDLLQTLDVIPHIIFTTAYGQYAVQAFEVNALDYLMKPFREERFAKAIEKARDVVSSNRSESNEMNKQILLKDGAKRFFIHLEEIYLIRSLENYTKLFFRDKKALQRRSLRQWESLLDKSTFFRINRREIVNLQYIQEVKPSAKGRLEIKLKTGESLTISNRQSVKFKNINLF